MLAVKRGNAAVVRTLLEHSDPRTDAAKGPLLQVDQDGNSPIHLAAQVELVVVVVVVVVW